MGSSKSPVSPGTQDWKATVEEACNLANIAFFDGNAKATLDSLIEWHTHIALDPHYSKEARNLVEQGLLEGMKRQAFSHT